MSFVLKEDDAEPVNVDEHNPRDKNKTIALMNAARLGHVQAGIVRVRQPVHTHLLLTTACIILLQSSTSSSRARM